MKFNANELLDSFNRELNQEEMNEIYKALIAYNLGLNSISAQDDEKLNRTIDFYLKKDYITSILNDDVLFYANELFRYDEPDIYDED